MGAWEQLTRDASEVPAAIFSACPCRSQADADASRPEEVEHSIRMPLVVLQQIEAVPADSARAPEDLVLRHYPRHVLLRPLVYYFFVATPTKIPPCPTVPPSPPGARALLPITRARGTASIETGGEGGALWNPPDADRTGTPPSPACGLWCDGLRGGVACPPRASRRCLAPRSGWLMGRACGVHGAPASPAPPPHPHTLPRSARRGRPRCRPPRRALAPARPARSSCAPGCAW